MMPCMLPRSAETNTRWGAFRRYAGLDHDDHTVGSFCDSPKMATELATQVTIKPLSQVDEAFAWDEGEGDDRTRDWWLAAHRPLFQSASGS